LDVGKSARMYKPIGDEHVPLSRDVEVEMPTTLVLSDCTLPEFMAIARDFGSAEYAYAVTPNVDHFIRFCDEESFRDLYRAAKFVLLDSRFLALVLRLTTGIRLPTSPGSDITARLFSDVILPDDKVVLIGSTAGQAEMLRRRHGLRDLVHYSPPMGFIHDPSAVEATLRFIEEQSPFRFCLLAVGCPQQEVLAKALKTRGTAKGLALCIGASINFITGGERRAPQWMRGLGLEWMFRLLQSPVRLSGRYLLRGPRIFLLLPRMKFKLRATDTERAS
jgi:exopolysaccharide biosynthesis WecB/TagA/CpsF family protein